MVGIDEGIGLAGAALMAALAVLLLVLDFERRANRAFALLLIYRAATSAAGFASRFASTETQALLQALIPYMVIPVAPAALYFALVHPRPRTRIAKHPAGPWLLMAGVGALFALYAWDHSWFATTASGTAAHGIMQAAPAHGAAPGIQYIAFGPLILFAALQAPALATLGVLFAFDHRRQGPGPERMSRLLVAAGFTLNGIFDGVRSALALGNFPDDAFAWAPWGWALAVLPILSLPLAMVALALLVARPATRPLRRRMLALAGLAAASAAYPVLVAGDGFLSGTGATVMLACWRLLLPVAVTYALLRYALFDLDFRLQGVVGNGAVAFIIGAIAFAFAEGTEAIVASASGSWAGLAAAAACTMAIRPLHRFGQRVAAALMPGVVPVAQAPGDRADLYRRHCRMVMEDCHVSAKERRLLQALANAWGLSRRRAHRIETEVAMETGAARPLHRRRMAAGTTSAEMD